ncbi:MAG TPA: YceI family protein [Pyrinomonadaceae bacterium]|nr:YceI family protein [Pyrinomonadaceae bacterium]
MKIRLAVIIFALSLASCSNPASDKPKAVTSDAAPASSAPAQGVKYSITPENSKIEFVGSKVTGKHNGGFGKFSGTINYNGSPEKSSVTINIDAASISADDPGLTKHLQSPDFFDVAKYPEATFTSTSITPGGDKGATHTVTGNLTMHGVTKSITFPATITPVPGSAASTGAGASGSPEAITVDATFSINRKDFGINYAGASDNLIRDEVVLSLKVRATK